MLICPHCDSANSTDGASCRSCGKKLLVVSSAGGDVPATAAGESISLEEHLLERVSLLEEALRGSLEGLQRALTALRRLERSTVVGQAGLAAFEEVLAGRHLVDAAELRHRWNHHLRDNLLALEKREVLESRRESILAEFAGDDPARFAAMLDEATEALSSLDARGALDDLEKALQLDPSNPQLASLVGELDFLAGRTRRALRHFTNALRRDPDQYDPLVYSGILLHQADEFEQADRNLRRAVELHSNRFLGWFALGSLHSDLGELRQAAIYLERALEIDRAPAALGLLGRTYRRIGKLGRAAVVLEEALELDPTDDEIRYELGRTWAARGWSRRALQPLTEAVERNPAVHGYGVMSNDLVAGVNPPQALTQALELCRQGRFVPAGRVARGVLSEASGVPTRTLASAVLIESLRAEGRLREGVESAEELLAVEDPLAQAVAECEMAWSLAELEEDLDRALELARQGVADAPAELQAQANAALGWVHFKRRNPDRARRRLEKAVELGENAAHLKLLGIVVLALGEAGPAAELLDRAESLTAADRVQESWLRDRRLDGLWSSSSAGGPGSTGEGSIEN